MANLQVLNILDTMLSLLNELEDITSSVIPKPKIEPEYEPEYDPVFEYFHQLVFPQYQAFVPENRINDEIQNDWNSLSIDEKGVYQQKYLAEQKQEN